MENKARTLESVTKHLIATSREFFAAPTPTVTMPVAQRHQFLRQAYAKHYRVALFFAGEAAPFVGHLTHALSGQRYVAQGYRSNVVRLVTPAQVTYIQKCH